MNNKIKLNEALLDKSQVLETKDLFPGVVARVRRTICEIDEKNANRRIYRKSLWEKLFQNEDFKRKLEARQILGNLEHPENSQLKYDKENNSHIVSNIFIGESFYCPIRKRNILRDYIYIGTIRSQIRRVFSILKQTLYDH
jgi:hypothetical protein